MLETSLRQLSHLAFYPARFTSPLLGALSLLLLAGCRDAPEPVSLSVDNEELTVFVSQEGLATITVSNPNDEAVTVQYTYEEVPFDTAIGRQFHISPDNQVTVPAEGDAEIAVHFRPTVVIDSYLTLTLQDQAKTVTIHGVGVNNPPVPGFDEDNPSTACPDVPFVFGGTVTDIEDAARLNTISAAFESDLEGVLAEGKVAADGTFLRQLTLTEGGEHTLSFQLTDTNGGEAEITTQIDVDDADVNDDGIPDCQDADKDGFSHAEGDCDDTSDDAYPGAREVCDGIDTDCDGGPDPLPTCDADGDGTSDWVDDDKDGFTEQQGDCNDGNDTVYPDAVELCDDLDNDCNATTDDGFDSDGDGQRPAGCPDGTDCDDTDATVYLGAEEVCDGRDNNCDSVTDEGPDEDGDGATRCQDCNDADNTVYPGAAEQCNGRDDDCDGTEDDGYDTDADGFATCERDGQAADCDDATASTYPGAAEQCNGRDDDCDGATDELPEYDQDEDGYTRCPGGATPADCADDDPAVNPGATEVCNDVDDDCDASTDEGFDADSDGYRALSCPNGSDCDEANAAVNPGAAEVCNATDDDCDGDTDEGFDADRDGFQTDDAAAGCAGLLDCDDSNGAVNPDAVEVCDSLDNDCNEEIDETDNDADGFTACDAAQPDCNDFNAEVYPGATETCNLRDDNCDGELDEPFDQDGDGVSTCVGDCKDSDPSAYPTINDSGWIEYLCNPVLGNTAGTGSDSTFTDQATVLYHDTAPEAERYKAWYRYGDSTNTPRIGYAVSPDGYTWTKKGIVFDRGATGKFDDLRLNYPTVLLVDGLFHLWYHGFQDLNPDPAVTQPSAALIGHATSVDGVNWLRSNSGNPVLLPSAGSWDSYSVQAPSVVWVEEEQLFYMWYAGNTASNAPFDIGLATSPDGDVWTKVDGDPQSPGTSPVLTRGTSNDWDVNRVTFPRATYNGMIFEMFYTGSATGPSGLQIGYAWSDDGVRWNKFDAPVLRNGGATWKATSVYSPSTVVGTDFEGRSVYSMWFSGQSSTTPSVSQTGIATNIQPDLQIVAPQDESHFTTSDTITFQAYVEDPFFVETISVRLESDLIELPLATSSVGENGYATFKLKLPAGTHTISVEAQDAGGLQSIDMITVYVQE